MEKGKRELLLDAALSMFVENGFENSPTSKIAKRAGVAAGTLFHYFETKEKLINDLYINTKVSLATALKKDLAEANTIRKKIKLIWYNSVTWAIDNPAGNSFFSMYKYSSYITETTREEGFKMFKFVPEILVQGVEDEILKNLPLDLLADALFSLTFGSVRFVHEHQNQFSDINFRDKIFALVWDSLKR